MRGRLDARRTLKSLVADLRNSRKSGWEWLDRDTSAFLYEYLTMGAGIPEPVRKHFGFDRDYLLYEKINGMDCDEYQRQQKEGRLPDVLVVDARLTNAVEKAFESVCRRPPDPYLDRLNEELERLGRIAARPDSVHDLIHVTPSFLAKYGIDRESPAEAICRQAEKAYRELDARFVGMTGRRPYADEFFRYLRNERVKQEQAASRGDTPRRKPRISFKPKAKGRGRGI